MDWSGIIENTLQALIGINACYFALAAIGLNVQFGFAGLLNFGQAAFMACGAYGLGMTARAFEISFWWGILLGVGYSVVLALLMGIPTLRLRADYLAIVTIATAEIIRLVVRSVQFKPAFGGSDGINNFSDEFRDVGNEVFAPADTYGFWPFEFSGREMWTLVIGWTLVAIAATFVFFLMRSPWGRVIKGIREDENAVLSLGKNVYGFKMSALIIGGVIGAFSGMVFALDRGSVQPDNYSRDVTFYVLTALVLGGVARVSGSIIGPMIFWAIFSFSSSFLREVTDGRTVRIGDVTILQSTDVGAFNLMLIGLMLMVLMAFRPQGLLGNREEMAFDGR